ncbi:MAG: protein-glutamate O-methyltransferase CheR [Oscillospiraceae bacterium]|nr:protein-glutamate O-methyltransferase CheR [Oscillospiraceae bacterium]
MIKITDQEFKSLVEFLKNKYGINLEQKRVLLEGRLTGYLEKSGFTNYTDYIKSVQLDKTGKEITNLLNKVTTNHTYFMREAEHFHLFKDHVLPELEQRVKDKDLRIWCAASSSGEEPYTLAMLLRDHFGGKTPKWDTKLLATDLSQKVLEQAKAGLYMEEAIKDVPASWKKKYFMKAPPNKNGDPMVQVTQEIKNEVVYKIFNLMDPIVAKKPYQVVFCRNVMIYFDMPTKLALVNRIYDATCPGGYLFIGHTESLPKPTRYNYIQPSVYQKGF